MGEFFIQKVKHDSNEVIIAVKTLKYQLSTQDVVNMINSGDIFFVLNKQDGTRVGIYAKKFIRSYRDKKWNNNLDNLPKF